MVPQIVHVNPNDVRVALDPSFKNAKPMPEPNITVNPFETKSKTTTTTVMPEQPNKQVTNAETTTETKLNNNSKLCSEFLLI
jgi:hypothetical protein